MTSTAASQPRSTTSLGRDLLNKVPEATLIFWIVKIMCTTVGESAADYFNESLGFGLSNTTYCTGALLAVLLLLQFRLRRYWPPVYWTVVVVISVFGTLITDNLTDRYGVPLATSTAVFAVILAAVFVAWWAVERTLSIHTIVTARRESFYWLAILFTFALGTATGDLVAEKFGLSLGLSVLLFGGLIAMIAIAHLRFGLNAVFSFWAAYILTRPLGASIGDGLSLPRAEGGLGIGATDTSYVFGAIIVGVVAYLTITHKDETPPAVASAA